MNLPFPNPTEHAVSLIETCKSAGAANEVAGINADFATTAKDYRYWSMVKKAVQEICVQPPN
jgi:hypothetical protein